MMTPEQQTFVLALSDRWLPFLFVLAGLVGTYLKLRSVEKGINGRVTQLIDATGHAARAEGKLEGKSEVPPVIVVPPVVGVTPGTPGGRRATDPPAPPKVPPDVDPSSHLP